MTEEEWLSKAQPKDMLDFLQGRSTQRKLRLFACACSRRVFHLLEDEQFWRIVDVIESLVDGQGQIPLAIEHERALRLFNRWRESASEKPGFLSLLEPAHQAVVGVASESIFVALSTFRLVLRAESADYMRRRPVFPLIEFDELDRVLVKPHCEVIDDIFGNPFRPVTFDPRWRTSDVVGLARAIYDDKAFERMPILADALMDAGCEDEQIIAHCRGDGPHVRGCWVVDLVLGKE